MGYNPEHDRLLDQDVLVEYIEQHPLASVITHDGVTPQNDLIPLLVEQDPASPTGFTLIGHVARANPLWREGKHEGLTLCSFGPSEHYISPTWYPAKAEHHRVVPTWNYLVVHAWGRLRIHDDERWVRGACAKLTTVMERGREEPWRMGQAPSDYLDEMLAKIVGISLPVERLEGRFKVSAKRSAEDRLGAEAGVRSEAAAGVESELLADRMREPVNEWFRNQPGA